MSCRSLSRLISFVLSFLVMLPGHPDVAIAARHDPDGGDDVAVLTLYFLFVFEVCLREVGAVEIPIVS